MTFGAPDVPQFTCVAVHKGATREPRGSAQDRGYDSEWSRLSKWHLKREPMCRECRFRGRRVPAEMTNHVIPVRDRPDLRLDKANLSSVCRAHHDTVIRDLEALARRMGDIELMRTWLTDPATRPPGHSYEAKGLPRLLREKRHEDRASAQERRGEEGRQDL